MSDLINLLPENIANQIAAGEVVQRPASVVKELLENAVDAKATKITFIVKEAGRMLIQVVDNGVGMSETDARICFERHATSKIESAEDLYKLNTLGFRGEALAAISAVAHVELKTRRSEDEIGTHVIVEGSKVVSQEPCSCDVGTSISVKNIFFNIPVRRNFLKSNTQEMKYIFEEFNKVALINSEIAFKFYNNDSLIFDLYSENFKQRIVSLINKSYKEKLIPIDEEAYNIRITGYICKPEFAKKTKGTDQYFFVNNRFIKHAYLRHAVETTYRELIPADMYPMFFIKIYIDPESIDVNIHPTKTEINFKDASTLYAILKTTIKKAFGTFSMKVPSIDFDVDPNFNLGNLNIERPVMPPDVPYNPKYNPFEGVQKKTVTDDWKELYNGINDRFNADLSGRDDDIDLNKESIPHSQEIFEFEEKFIQYKNKYIIGIIDRGIIIIDQQKAHERILYEEYIEKLNSQIPIAQTDIFPETITVNIDDALILDNNKDLFEKLGFRYEKLGKMNYVINSYPNNISQDDTKGFLEAIIGNLKNNISQPANVKNQVLARITARKLSVKEGQKLQDEEMLEISRKLFKCKVSDNDLDGVPTYAIIDMEAVSKFF